VPAVGLGRVAACDHFGSCSSVDNERRLIEYDEFLTHHKRTPRYRGDDPAERSIADWAVRQRCRLRAARMPADQVQGFAYVERRAARVGSRMGPRERRTGL
jgi:hypothetical protein